MCIMTTNIWYLNSPKSERHKTTYQQIKELISSSRDRTKKWALFTSGSEVLKCDIPSNSIKIMENFLEKQIINSTSDHLNRQFWGRAQNLSLTKLKPSRGFWCTLKLRITDLHKSMFSHWHSPTECGKSVNKLIVNATMLSWPNRGERKGS